jgi:hypothetical protein
LPQDFTLFVLLRHTSIDIWREKLDWVASKGGMCLLITHPDYMNFDRRTSRFDEYPVELYKELCGHVKDRYTRQFWNALPRDVARYYKQAAVKI